MPTLVDSYNVGSGGNEHHVSSVQRSGESFTPSVSGNMLNAGFYLRKTGAPTGTYVYSLYAITGTPGTTAKPTGAALAQSYSMNIASIPTSETYIEAPINGGYPLVVGTHYFITVDFTFVSSGAGNSVRVGGDVSTSDSGANGATYSSGAWSADTNTFIKFFAYAGIPTGNISIYTKQGYQ